MTMVSPYRTSPYQQAVYKNLSLEHLAILGQRPRSRFERFVDLLRGAKRVKEERERAAAELLRSGDLAGYDLTGIDWNKVPGNVTDKERSPLIGAQLQGCKFGDMLRGVVMMEAHLEGVNLEGAYLTGAYLTGAKLEGANLVRANLWGANLVRAKLEGADLRQANLVNAELILTNLKKAHLEGAHLERADLRGADLKKAHLEGAHLERADLRGADGLDTVCFEKAEIAGAMFPEGFQPSSTAARASAVVPAPAATPQPPLPLSQGSPGGRGPAQS